MSAETISSRSHVLSQHPGNNIDISTTFSLKTTDVPKTLPPNTLLVKNLYFSNEPSQRTWISSSIPQERHYMKLVQLGEAIPSSSVARVVSSTSEKYKEGDMVNLFSTWSEYNIIKESEVIAKVQTDPADFIALGGTALTAYFGLFNIAKPKDTDKTIVISGAAGATGSVAVQIAKHVLNIPNVIAIAGSEEKCNLLLELGADVALNYKSPTFTEDFIKATPEYIDIYYDNVGGSILNTAINRMARNGRVVACGAISAYDDSDASSGVSMESWMKIITMRVRVEGFILFDFKEEYGEAKGKLVGWAREGKIKPLKTVWETRFEGVPGGMVKLLRGENVGKLVTKVVE